MFTGMKNSEMTMVIAELADHNYYNNGQNLVRVKFGTGSDVKYYDMTLINNIEYPNPQKHYVLVYTLAKYLEYSDQAIPPSSERLSYIPGYIGPETLANEFAFGYVWLINKEVRNNNTNMNVSHMGTFNQDANLASDPQNVRFALSPSLNKPYTTTEGEYQGDVNDQNIGVFVTDNSIHLKSAGGSIVLGPDGISLLGTKTESHTTSQKGLMQDNPLKAFIPPTLMTIPAGINYIPNIDYILSIGNTLNRVIRSTSAIGKVTKIISEARAIG